MDEVEERLKKEAEAEAGEEAEEEAPDSKRRRNRRILNQQKGLAGSAGYTNGYGKDVGGITIIT